MTSSIAQGTHIGPFEVRRLIATGGMGEVYLARDKRLGRRVALKLVKPNLVDAADVEGFLREARITAKFAHPNIVTVYDVGEHLGRPWLALEYLEGESLKDRANTSTLSAAEALRIAQQIAEGLAEAHAHGVLHRDLKPANVLVGKDGRVRVLDFGISSFDPSHNARAPHRDSDTTDDGDDTPSGPPVDWGTARYMAPEQWRRDPITGAVDVWALGIILYELLARAHPFAARGAPAHEIANKVTGTDAPRVQNPDPRVVDLVAACLARDVGARATAVDVARTIDRILHTTSEAPAHGEDGPFPGLLPYLEDRASSFFGRDDEVASLVERARATPLIVVTGPSGAGKSSLVLAGMIPRMREAAPCVVVTTRPGREPCRLLARHLLGADCRVDDEERLMRELASEPASLQRLLKERAPANGRAVLFVNQLEELFTLGAADTARAYVRMLALAADDPDDPDDPVRVVVTIRDDYLGRWTELLRDVGSAGAEARTYVAAVSMLDRKDLAAVLERAPAHAGYGWDEPGVVEEIIDDVGDAPAPLPLVQFACALLWDARDRDRKLLLAAKYRAMGGVRGALASHANGILDAMSTREVELARRIFLRIVTQDGLSRASPLDELVASLPEGGEEVVRRLVRGRLLLTRARSDGGASEVEIAHEALVRSWSRLARWLDESRVDRGLLDDLAQSATLWDRRGRPADALWRGRALEEVETALTSNDIVGAMAQPPPLAMALVAASRAAERSAQRRRVVVRVAAVTLTAVVVVVSLAAAALFRDSERGASMARDEALRRQAEAMSAGGLAAWERGDVVEARARLRSALEIGDANAARALWWRLHDDAFVDGADAAVPVNNLALSPDTKLIALAASSGDIVVIDRSTRTQRRLRGSGEQMFRVGFVGNDRVVAMTYSHALTLWTLAPAESLVESPVESPVESSATSVPLASNARAFGVSPDGRVLAWVGEEGSISFVDTDVTSPVPATVTRNATRADRVALSNDALFFAAAGTVWHVPLARGPRNARAFAEAAKATKANKLADGVVGIIAVSDDGARIALGSGAAASVLDVATGARRALVGHGALLTGITIDGAGTHVATSSRDGVVRVFRVSDGALERRFVLGARGAGVSLSPDGKALAVASAEGDVRIFNLAASSSLAPSGHDGALLALAVAPAHVEAAYGGAGVVATGSTDQTVRLFNAGDGTERAMMSFDEQVWSLAFDPDPLAPLLAVGGERGALVLVDVERQVIVRRLAGHTDTIQQLAFSADGAQLASASVDGTVRTWDVVTGRAVGETKHRGPLTGVAALPQGWVATAFDGKVLLVNDSALREVGAHSAAATRVASFADAAAPARARFVTVGVDAALREFIGEARTPKRGDVEWTWRARETWPLPADAVHVALDARGARAAATTTSGVFVVDLTTPSSRPMSLGDENAAITAAFSRDDRAVLTGSDDGALRAFDVTSTDGATAITTGRARWRAPLLRALPADVDAELCSHRGCALVRAAPSPSLTGAWRTAILDRARRAHAADDALCIETVDGAIERWFMAADAMQSRIEAKDVKGASCAPPPAPALAAATQRGSFPMTAEVPLTSSISARGFADGTWGVWDTSTGTALATSRLRGPIAHLVVHANGRALTVASSLGDARRLSLDALVAPWCDVMTSVWRDIDVAWGDVDAVVAPPPATHECRAQLASKG